jgi:flavin-dependent thymidylate synthase
MPNGEAGPRVTLLNATPDPLGSLAALNFMYSGRVVRNLAEITDAERRMWLEEVTKSELQGPLEVVQFHFLVEGVTRSFTHQMVRERQAFFAQESLRFAVPEEDWVASGRVPYPPSVAGGEWIAQTAWDDAVAMAQTGYEQLINLGIPAEDARGLMPHSITTRLHWVLDLRGLLHVAGLRLCTQAQFEWRYVMASVVQTLRGFSHTTRKDLNSASYIFENDAWQFQLIADKLRPVCYQIGRCGFKNKFDRPCSIRDRVDANERESRPAKYWDKPLEGCAVDPQCSGGLLCDSPVTLIEPIHPSEWAADPTAARRKP